MNTLQRAVRFAGMFFAGLLMLVGGVTIVHGQTLGSSLPSAAQLQAQMQQMIQGRLAALSAIPNQRVCDTAAGDTAACTARVVVDARSGRVKTAALPSGYGPAQFTGAYNLTGKSSASVAPLIAIVDAYDDPNIAKDLRTYSSTYGIVQLPNCSGAISASKTECFQKLNQNGKTNSLPRGNASWDLEIALDVEAAHATCQNCRIALVEANSASFTDLLKAVDTAVAQGAVAVSGSWGASEFASETSYDSHFNKPNVAFTFSAGDSGFGTLYPAASPYVTAVGGTTLLLNGNSYLSESVWSGSGSGCSKYEGSPAWQSSSLCATRTMNDVAADANPASGAAVYDSVRYGGMSGWFQVGGTSLSAPIVAAVYALSGNVSGAANSIPYALGSSASLNDVTNGSNGSCGGSLLCAAGVGYDGPTGLGTPNGTAAF